VKDSTAESVSNNACQFLNGGNLRVYSYISNLLKTSPGEGATRGIRRFIKANPNIVNKETQNNLVNEAVAFDEEQADDFFFKMCCKKQEENSRLGTSADIERHHMALVEMFGLNGIDSKILLLFLDAQTNPVFNGFCDSLFGLSYREMLFAMGSFIGLSGRDVENRLDSSAPLIAKGIVSIRWDGNGFMCDEGYFYLPRLLCQAISAPFVDSETLISALLGETTCGRLGIADYDHIKEKVDLFIQLLKNSSNGEERGINIMLWGPAGAGKTELTKTVADMAGVRLYMVGEKNEDGEEPTREERITALAMANALCSHRGKTALLFDEAEDILKPNHQEPRRDGRAKGYSKVFINRLLEKNTVPIIWTSNSIHDVEPAVLRRMTLIIGFEPINSVVRERVWKKYNTEKTGLSDEDIGALSRDWCVQPALINNAARVSCLTNGGKEAAEIALHGHSFLVEKSRDDENALDERFDPRLICGSMELTMMRDYLFRPGAKLNWSACFYGEPGTGKSEYARYLAKEMGLPVITARGSDVLSEYVGKTEKNIAEVFAEARRRKSVLIIDEADSLIFSRKNTKYNWEVGQVEEFLIWMEKHPFPFIATTNLIERLDVASLRRFVFKARFDYLDEQAGMLAFVKFFGFRPSRRLPSLLSLGDMANASKRAALLDVKNEDVIISWLREEVGLRENRRIIGFQSKDTACN
jgi:SpoVK/Ycf46/Vps4 family AAA+-type ATPase